MKNRKIRVSEDFARYIEEQLQLIIQDCEALGIKKSKISRPKVTNLLLKKIKDIELKQKEKFKIL